MELRPYQTDAVNAVYEHLRTRDDNPCVVIPTGGGKTPVIATICRDAAVQWGGRVLVLAHVKELLAQSVEKLRIIAPDLPVGVYSAGLGSKDLCYAVTVAGIQSIYRRADKVGPVDLVIVDEAHLIPPDGEGMYQTFLAEARKLNPGLRVIGMTATPYRLRAGHICGAENILNHVCYEIGVADLIGQGYLCKLRSARGSEQADTSGLHVRGGEFVAEEVSALMSNGSLVRATVADMLKRAKARRGVLVFCASVDHARVVAEEIRSQSGELVGEIFGHTDDDTRDWTIREFVGRRIRFLVNVNVLTTGFDAPHVDCVAMLRPTMSPGLYYQMVGRGFRLFPDKADCLVLDYAGNVMRHGPVDILTATTASGGGEAPVKACPECDTYCLIAARECDNCGYVFPIEEKPIHADAPTVESVVSTEEWEERAWVEETTVYVHEKRNAPDAPKTMRVEYKLGWGRWQKEWVCFSHEGFARRKAEQWWRERSRNPVPESTEEAVELFRAGACAKTLWVRIKKKAGSDFPEIVEYNLGPKPEPVNMNSDAGLTVPQNDDDAYGLDPDDIPF